VRRALVLSAVLAALAAPGTASGADKTLIATVGPAFTISLVTEAGQPVTRLDPGTYRIVVRDRSDMHNFRLTGPGVNRATTVAEVTDEEWTVTLAEGVYTFFCDPHPSSMRGRFTVGSPPSATVKRLTATVGPAATITIRTAAGKPFKTTAPGGYRITVADRSRAHNFRLVGPGVNRATGVAFTGTVTWTVALKAGTYEFRCDPHRARMRGSFSVR
jgi:plastocyanin